MCRFPAVFLHVRYWAANGRYSYSASLMKDQGSVRVSIIWARNRNYWSEEQLIVYLTVRR